VPSPRVVGFDDDGSETGTPCTLTTALIGAPDLRPVDFGGWLEQLARTQAEVHSVPGHLTASSDGFYDTDASLEWLSDAGLREEARQAVEAGSSQQQLVLGHGDYQHFNVLWDSGELTGVVDWPNSAMTRRGVDVGHCRLNLAVLFSVQAAEDYLTWHERVAGVSVDPSSDLRAVLNFDPDWQEFIPVQIHGRAHVDAAGMPARVTELVRRIMARIG
jgi:aminoglycoside phosphotransferase (APT) family kinase protein